nr:MAG TPA: hypothetical protein [Caudoviricetes sp.]
MLGRQRRKSAVMKCKMTALMNRGHRKPKS